MAPIVGEVSAARLEKPTIPDVEKQLSDALKAGYARPEILPPEIQRLLPEAEQFVAARKAPPGGEGVKAVAKPLPPAGGAKPPEGRVIVGGRRGEPGSPEPRPYPKDITVDPRGGDIPKRVEVVARTNPELIGNVPEVYFERTPPVVGLNNESLQAAQQLLNQCGGPIRITTTLELVDATRTAILSSEAEIVSEGMVEVTTKNATTVGYEFLLKYK